MTVQFCDRCGGACLRRYEVSTMQVCRTCYKEFMDLLYDFLKEGK